MVILYLGKIFVQEIYQPEVFQPGCFGILSTRDAGSLPLCHLKRGRSSGTTHAGFMTRDKFPKGVRFKNQGKTSS